MAFAQMKPGELLRESERAMGDAHLQTLHEELTAERKELLNYERVCTHCLLAAHAWVCTPPGIRQRRI